MIRGEKRSVIAPPKSMNRARGMPSSASTTPSASGSPVSCRTSQGSRSARTGRQQRGRDSGEQQPKSRMDSTLAWNLAFRSNFGRHYLAFPRCPNMSYYHTPGRGLLPSASGARTEPPHRYAGSRWAQRRRWHVPSVAHPSVGRCPREKNNFLSITTIAMATSASTAVSMHFVDCVTLSVSCEMLTMKWKRIAAMTLLPFLMQIPTDDHASGMMLTKKLTPNQTLCGALRTDSVLHED